MGRSDAGEVHGELTLRHRLLDYGALFGAGLVAATTVGLLIGVLTSAAVLPAIGYTIVVFGVIWMLAGGMSGGGFGVLGIGKGVGRYTYAIGDGNDPLLDEMRHGYRPEPDPIAFWQVVAGVLYVVVGIGLITAGP